MLIVETYFMSLIRLCPQCGSTSKKKEGNFKGKWHLGSGPVKGVHKQSII
jgi:hypothetical protein